MTPGARVAAAIDILDDMAGGLAAEQALTRWARRSRFAGSKDRAAIRDHVFDVLRCRRTAAHLGGGESGRALMLGLLRQQAADLDAVFSGIGHAPEPVSPDERGVAPDIMPKAVKWNLPDWLVPHFDASLGQGAERAATALQERAPVFLRVNLAKSSLADAQVRLHDSGIDTEINPLSPSALRVVRGERKIRNSEAYQTGHVELQDAASQAVVDCLPKGGRVLDYCAGGGGKSLALAMDANRRVFAHDIAPERMSDLPERAGRAGSRVTLLNHKDLAAAGPFDVILCDAPCSGSGAWRRAPEGKWILTADRLEALQQIQIDILRDAAQLLDTGGVLAYATCSVLQCENEQVIEAFLTSEPGFVSTLTRRFDVGPDGDGFFTAHLMRQH